MPEIRALADAAGLEIAGLIEPWRYDPDSYVNDGTLRRRLAGLDWLERAAVAELIVGNIKKHSVYLVRAGRGAEAVARADDPEAVPVMRDDERARSSPPASSRRATSTSRSTVSHHAQVPRLARPILTRVDGRRTLGRSSATRQKTPRTARLGQFRR